MKTEIKTLVLAVKEKDDINIETGEIEKEEEQFVEIPVTEIIEYLSKLNRDLNDFVKIIGFKEQTFYDEDEVEELENENEELKAKLENAWGFIDNVEEHLSDMRTRLNDALDDIDEAEDDASYAKDECEQWTISTNS